MTNYIIVKLSVGKSTYRKIVRRRSSILTPVDFIEDHDEFDMLNVIIGEHDGTDRCVRYDLSSVRSVKKLKRKIKGKDENVSNYARSILRRKIKEWNRGRREINRS